MKKILLLLLSLALYARLLPVWAQEAKPDFGVRFSGLVKNDFILDSRQSVTVRDGHFLLYPKPVRLDKDGVDVNAPGSFTYLSIQSRLTGTIWGPDAFGAKTSGLIEGAFFGQTDANINGFRLRHAYVQLDWAHTRMILGQYWHLLFVPENFPGTVSFNTGVPFQFFSRNPQIYLRHTIGKFSLAGMLGAQLDFANPIGPVAVRNALLPDMQGELSFRHEKSVLLGLHAGFRRIVPRLITTTGYSTNSAVEGITLQVQGKFTAPQFTFKFAASYLEDAFDGLTIGGFVVKQEVDPLRNILQYETLNTATAWVELHNNHPRWQVGLFAAYAQNLGSKGVVDDIKQIPQFSRGSDIAQLYRISPRVVLTSGKTRIACEWEHTAAAYGSSWSTYAVPQQTAWVANDRIWVAAYYFF